VILLIQIELLKLVRRPLTWLLLLLQLGTLGLGTLLNVLALRRAAPEREELLLRGLLLPDSLANAAQFLAIFGAMFLATLTAAAVGSEYSWGTLRQQLATGVGRLPWLAAKLVALVGMALGLIVLSLLASALVAVVVARTHGVPTLLAPVELSWLLALVGRTTLTLLMPMALAFLIAVLARSQLLALAAALGALIADQFASPILWSLGTPWALELIQFFPFWCIRSLLAFNFRVLPADLPNLMSEERALLTLASYTAGCVAAALLIFRSRDVGGAV
jgi:ABC-type transport system involved in multi-copper enzyme maturation permease subunit